MPINVSVFGTGIHVVGGMVYCVVAGFGYTTSVCATRGEAYGYCAPAVFLLALRRSLWCGYLSGIY